MVSAFGGILVMIGFMMIAGSANDCDGACMEYANTLGEMALIIFLMMKRMQRVLCSPYIIGRWDIFPLKNMIGILVVMILERLKLQKQYSKTTYLRLINNAEVAYQRCVASGSEWGQNYWRTVINELLRKAQLTVH